MPNMTVTTKQLRHVIRECMRLDEGVTADTIHAKFPFIGKDAVQLLMQFIWRFSSDVAKKKGGTADQGQTQEIAQDVTMSVGESLKDLINHFVPDDSEASKQKRLAPPPPSKSGSRQAMQQPQKQESAPASVDEEHYSDWPVPMSSRK